MEPILFKVKFGVVYTKSGTDLAFYSYRKELKREGKKAAIPRITMGSENIPESIKTVKVVLKTGTESIKRVKNNGMTL